MKKSTHEDVRKVIMKKFEDEDECKGEGSIRKISIPMEKFKNQGWSLPWSVSSSTYFQSHNGITYEEHHLTLNTKKKTIFQSSRKEDPYLAWSKHVSSEGGLL